MNHKKNSTSLAKIPEDSITLSIAWLSAILSVLMIMIYEIVNLAINQSDSHWGPVAIHIFSLFGALLVLVPFLFALFFPNIIRAYGQPKQWIGLALTPEERLNYLSSALTRACSSLIIAIGLFAGAYIAHGFNRILLASFWVVATGISTVILAGLLAPTWFSLFKSLLKKVSPNVSIAKFPLSLIPTLLLLLMGLFGLNIVSKLPLGAYQFTGYVHLGLLPVLTIAFYVALSWLGGSLIIPKSLQAITYILVIIISILGLKGWDTQHPSNRLIPQQAQVADLLLKVGRQLSDGDGDGVSAALGGGDCDDNNPNINPMAKDIPENGIDENCQGGDAKKPKIKKPKVVKQATIAHKWNVLFILVDTLRASHLDLNGYERQTMPNLKKFGEDAVYFERAFAHAPRTPFSIPSVLIGRYPSRLQWVKRFANYSVLKDDNETMFERFKTAGWQTEAVSAHWYFGKKKAVNLNQGLDQWDNRGEKSVSESNTQSEAQGITKRLIDRLKTLSQSKQEHQKPFFMFAHYFAPHGRYMTHEIKCRQSKNWCHKEPRCKEHPSQCMFGDKKAKSVQKLINKYDSELAYTDIHLGDVFKAYKELGLDQNTIVVITSDHGESFKDRKPAYLFHGRSVYNEELHVPLLIKTPKSVAQRRSELVGLVDISPTLSALTGVKSGVVDGVSLSPLLEKKTQAKVLKEFKDRYVFLEQLPYPGHKVHMVGAVHGSGVKMIRNVSDQTWSSFNLNTDWAETKNLFNKKADQTQKDLKQALNEFIEQTP